MQNSRVYVELQQLRSQAAYVLWNKLREAEAAGDYGSVAKLALAILRSGTLQAYAQFFASNCSILKSTAPCDPDEEDDSRVTVCTTAVYGQYQEVFCILLGLAVPAVNAASPHRRVVRRALLSALADSQVLEHAARLRLGLQDYEVRAQQAKAQRERSTLRGRADSSNGSAAAAGMAAASFVAACDDSFGVVVTHWLADMWLPQLSTVHTNDTISFSMTDPAQELGARQRSQLRSILSGPCLQALLGWQLAAPLSAEAAAAAPVWGLPAGMQLAVPEHRAHAVASVVAFEYATQVSGSVWLGLMTLDDMSIRLLPSSHTSRLAASTSAGQAAQPSGRSRRVPVTPPQLPYSVGNVMLMLRTCMAHIARSEAGLSPRTIVMAAGCFVAGWRRMRPAAAADCLRELWAQLLPALRRACGAAYNGPKDAVERYAHVGGMLLMLDVPPPAPSTGGDGTSGSAIRGAAAPRGRMADASTSARGGAAEGGAGSRSGGSNAPPPGPSWSLRCALDAGLLRTLEGALRLRTADRTPTTQRANVMLVDFLLRRPGVWPAVLAHGPPDQVAALVVSLRKVVAAAAAGFSPEMLWHLQLRGLLEQAAAALAEMDARGATSAGVRGETAGRVASSGFSLTERLCRQLRANQGISEAVGKVATDGYPSTADRFQAAPVPADVARAGGCPAAGSPAAEQLRRLAVFAAAQWLPGQLTARAPSGARACNSLSALTAHQSHLVLLHWLLLAAEGCCHAGMMPVFDDEDDEDAGEPAGGSASAATGRPAAGAAASAPCYGVDGNFGCDCDEDSVGAALRSWRGLLLQLNAPLLVLNELAMVRMQACELPLVEVTERLVRVLPDIVAEVLALLVRRGPGRELAVRRAAMEAITRRHGRHGLLAALRQLEGFGGGMNLPRDWVAEQLEEEMGGLPGRSPLPPPCVAAEALRLCDNPECAVLAGGSEADAQLLVCGGCRAVRYCCAACQRQHWREGHKAKCRGGR